MIIWIVHDGSSNDILSAWDNVDDAIEAAALLMAELDGWQEDISWYREVYRAIRKSYIYYVTDCFGYYSITQINVGGR